MSSISAECHKLYTIIGELVPHRLGERVTEPVELKPGLSRGIFISGVIDFNPRKPLIAALSVLRSQRCPTLMDSLLGPLSAMALPHRGYSVYNRPIIQLRVTLVYLSQRSKAAMKTGVGTWVRGGGGPWHNAGGRVWGEEEEVGHGLRNIPSILPTSTGDQTSEHTPPNTSSCTSSCASTLLLQRLHNAPPPPPPPNLTSSTPLLPLLDTSASAALCKYLRDTGDPVQGTSACLRPEREQRLIVLEADEAPAQLDCKVARRRRACTLLRVCWRRVRAVLRRVRRLAGFSVQISGTGAACGGQAGMCFVFTRREDNISQMPRAKEEKAPRYEEEVLAVGASS
ncbi:unnamed protein product [Lota lota]